MRWGIRNILSKKSKKGSCKIWLPRNISMTPVIFSSPASGVVCYGCEVRLRILELCCNSEFFKSLFPKLKCSVTNILWCVEGLGWAVSPADAVFITSPFGVFHPSIRCSTDDSGKNQTKTFLQIICFMKTKFFVIYWNLKGVLSWSGLFFTHGGSQFYSFLDYFPGL